MSADIDSKLKRTILIRTITLVITMVAVLFALGGLVVNAYIGAQSRNLILDCTDPEGQCYQEGASRSADVVKQLIEQNDFSELATRRVVVVASVCAELPDIRSEQDKAERITLMQRCVQDTLDIDLRERKDNER